MPDVASGCLSSEQIDAMSGIFFDTMSGVKTLANLMPAMTCPTLAFESSIQQ